MPATASNHVKNGGQAVDIANYRTFAAYCGQYGFVHSFPSSDPVHFDHVGLAPSGNPGANQVTKDRQNRCLQLGISVGPHGADGIEGKDTKAAYKEYQLRLVPYGYPATMIDGVWGPKMQAAHEAMLAAEAAASVQGTANLARGSEGPAVKALQVKLAKTYPAYQTQHGKLFPDGNFGAITEAWVKEFQRRSGLKDDGIVGPKTRKALGL
jgi:peptidoglycan hydrolase-like protein with peptidoglycan-binding domain